MIEGPTIRLRSAIDVVDEIEDAHYRYGATDFEFVDAVFNDPPNHAQSILEETIKRPWRVNLSAAGIDPTHLDRSFLDLMWRSGFRSLMLSPESASDSVLQNYGKSFSIDDVCRAAESINKTRLSALWYFLVGGPGETNNTLKETLDFIQKYLKRDGYSPDNNIILFCGVRVYPRTKLWDIALSEELIEPDTDPLKPCWYVSRTLELEYAMEEITRAASECPQIYLGSDEAYLSASRIGALIWRIRRRPKPYWRHIWRANRLLMKLGLRFILAPSVRPEELRKSLERKRCPNDLASDE